MESEKQKVVKEIHLRESLAKIHNVPIGTVQKIEWQESKGAAADDGYTTEIVAAKGTAIVQDKTEEFSLMVKMTPNIGYRVEMVKQMGIFDKEYLIYGVILPQMMENRKEHGLEPLSIPQCFYAHPDPGVLVMSNLKGEGFDLIKNRPLGLEKGMQGPELELFLRALGRFHASSHHLMTQLGGKSEMLKKYPMLERVNPMNKNFENMFKNSMMTNIDNWQLIAKDYLGQEASERIGKFKEKAFGIFCSGFEEPCGEYQTIIHGDSWQNNAMFKYQDDLAVEVALLDFQCSRVSSPACDLSYAIYTGTRPDLHDEHLEEWLKIYHNQFSSDLTLLGCNPDVVYPFEAFKKDFDDLFGYGFTWAIQHTQMLLDKEGFNMEEIKNKSPEELEKVMNELKSLVYQQSKTNTKLRERVIGMLEKAMQKNLI